jgi:hypothetical protein
VRGAVQGKGYAGDSDVAVAVSSRAIGTLRIMAQRGSIERADRAAAPLDGLENPALAMVQLSVETRPRWFDRIAHALTRLDGRLTLSPMPAERIGNAQPNSEALGPDGWSLVVQPTWPRTAGGAPAGGAGVIRVDLRAMSAHRLAWTPRPGGPFGPFSIAYAPSPDGAQVAVAEMSATEVVRESGPVTLLAVPTEGGAPRELLVLPPSAVLGGWEDRHLQWSPDGRMLALSYRENGAFGPTTAVVDVATGEVVCRAAGTALMGSVSFSDDGTRLLVGDDAWYMHILDVATGEQVPIAWLPDSKPDPGPRLTACGFIGNEHLLTTRQRTGTVTVSAVHLDTGDETPLLRWVGGHRNAPHTGTFSRQWLLELERALHG